METKGKTGSNEGAQMRGAIWQAMSFAWDFGIVVVVPIVVLGVGGRLLDKHFGTEPWLFLAGVISSIGLSVFLLVVRLKKIIAKLTKPNEPPTKTSL